jgi:ATP-dependent Lon protease
LRELERNLAAICRKYVRNKIEKNKVFRKISRHNMHHYLGVPLYTQTIDHEDEIGVVKSLAWTDSGGDVLPVEVSILNGRGNLTLTGKMGEVMQESAKAALTFVRSRFSQLGIEEDFYKKMDIHIHMPEGAIAKDGPSAGITIATAIASALAGLPVRGDLAMTGEITLRGRILPVGGLKEKTLAALRYGLKTILIPEDNKNILQTLPAKIKRKIKFIPVKKMDDVLFFAIKGYKDAKTKNNKKKITPEILNEDDISDEQRDYLS